MLRREPGVTTAAGGGRDGSAGGPAQRNRAVTVWAFVIVTAHPPLPEHAPLQSLSMRPEGFSVTRVPEGKLAPHTPDVHLIPAGVLVTVPAPPVTFTVSV